MSVFDFLRDFFGLSRKYNQENPFYRDDFTDNSSEEQRRSFWRYNHNEGEEDDDDGAVGDFSEQPFGFKIFSDPLEIHRFFEKQLDDMLKTFQMFESDSKLALEGFGSMAPSHRFQERAIGGGTNPRDEVLKPEYRHRLPGFKEYSHTKREDNDLDESVKGSSLSEILDKEPSQVVVIPDRDVRTPVSSFRSFGKSVTSKTVRRPDGHIEHHHTVRDSEGNEKTTVTHQVGDQRYTVITEKDANGILKSTESFENIDEGNIEDFKRKWTAFPQQPGSEQQPDQSMKLGGIDFSKFFKLT